MLKNKVIKIVIAVSTALLYMNPTVLAEEDNPCGNIQTQADVDACNAYQQQLKASNAEAAKQLEEIQAKRAEIAADIAKYAKQLETYQAELDTLNQKVEDLNTQIASIQTQIDDTQAKTEAKQAEIDENQGQIMQLGDKVKSRMSSSQSGMRINKTFSILMGASTFQDFIRIANGLSDISNYDNETTQQLVTLSEKLKTDKAELQDLQQQLETQKESLTAKQEEVNTQKESVAIKQAEIQVIKDAAEDSAAEMEAQGNTIAENISDVKNTISSNASNIEEFQKKLEEQRKQEEANKNQSGSSSSSGNSSASGGNTPSGTSGWVNPVPGAYRSAGTWNYPGGGKHLGYDFAASTGTTIRAVGDGYVINSADGCAYGSLGSTCHGTGGSSGGGNQVYLLTAVNGSLYAVKYLHMQLNSPVATGTWVSAGDYVGRVGATGNVTGPHCHVEIFYLGDASNFSNYLYSWNGDLAFGCGWAGSYDGYGRRCEAGYGAPCRIRPESVFG